MPDPQNGKFERYGYRWTQGTTDATIELYCFAHGSAWATRFEHLRGVIDRVWNDFVPGTLIFNDWSEWMLATFCEKDWVTITGPGASWKTTCAAIFALASWYSSPTDTVVICTSTTLDGLRRRIWKEISKFYRLQPLFGNPVMSRNCIQFEKGIDDAGIFGLATDKGEIEKALGKIIGFHSPNYIVIVDEMPYTPEAIVEACVNLQTGSNRFQFIGLGNADDQLDPHGKMCEPKSGWDSITEETEQWETRRGVCIHLDGLKSPNVVAKEKKYPGLINQEDIDTTIEIYGADSPQFWQMRRGFWAPEGIQKTVLSMPMIVRSQAMDNCFFNLGFTHGAALDPAFEGGDRCALRLAKCGWVEDRKILLLGEKILIKTKASTDDPVHYQIARQVKDECEKRGVSPQMFALDSTGEGGGLASIIQREWSPQILCVEFGGRPTKEPVSQTNAKRGDEEYDRRVTQLWYFFRLLVQNGQVKGLDQETATEFCRRFWEMKGPYISIETKIKMKERTGFSPDWADNAVILAELFHQRDKLNLLQGEYQAPPEIGWEAFQRARSIETTYEAVEVD